MELCVDIMPSWGRKFLSPLRGGEKAGGLPMSDRRCESHSDRGNPVSRIPCPFSQTLIEFLSKHNVSISIPRRAKRLGACALP